MPLPDSFTVTAASNVLRKEEAPAVLAALKLRIWLKERTETDPEGGTVSKTFPAASVVTSVGPDGVARVPSSIGEADELDRVEVLSAYGWIVTAVPAATLEEDDWEITLPTDEVPRLKPTQPDANPPLDISGRFQVFGRPDTDFRDFQLAVAAIDDEGLRKVFEDLDDTRPTATVREIASPEDILVGHALTAAKVDYDGSFAVRLKMPVDPEPVGWMYVLTGPRNFVGFRKDTPKAPPEGPLLVFLPKGKAPLPTIGADGAGGRGSASTGTAAGRPIDASEDQLLRNPGLFTDDPGTFCKPFSNPERVLGERSFHTVLRVEAPEIAQAAGIRAADMVERQLDAGPTVTGDGNTLTIEPGATDPDDIRDAVTDLGAVRPNISGMLEHLRESRFKSTAAGRQPPGGDNLIDWEGDTTPHQAVTVAGGHILDWRVRWRSNGYSLGSVSHTLTLAPRQMKRIMKVDFARRERARRDEQTLIDDEVDQVTESERDYRNAVASDLTEWSKGKSNSHTVGTSVGIGAALPGVVIGGGASHGSAWGSAENRGERNAAANEEQSLRDAIRQHGESLRQMESTVITEIEQQETVEGVSETIANPNHCHSLSVIYYDILRHLRVDTELAGVSECLYVPLPITPFATIRKGAQGPRYDLRRIIRHAGTLKRYLKDRKLRWVFDHLEDYQRGFAGAPELRQPRKRQELVSLRGRIDLLLDIASPLKGDEDAEAMADATEEEDTEERRKRKLGKIIGAVLLPYAPVIGIGVAAASALLAKRTPEERQRAFDTEVAPHMARRFVDHMRFFATSPDALELEGTDFTLEGSYRKGRVHRVHFQVPPSKLIGITRERIEAPNLNAPELERFLLPAFSVANVKGVEMWFATTGYRRRLRDTGLHDDLLVTSDTDSERATASSATLSFPASKWENEILADKIVEAVHDLVQHLEANRHYYHKMIWWRMDRDELFTLLDGYTLSETDPRSIASVVEHRPMAVAGNSLVFRVARGAFVGVGGHRSLDAAFEAYGGKGRKSDPMRISLPTGGVYAQALMDECNACEEHYGSTDWVLDQGDLLPQELDPGLLASRRAEPQGLTPSQMPETLINLQNAPAAPPPTGLAAALDAAGNAGAFRDLSGLAGTQANAAASMQSATALASQFGNLGFQNRMAQLKADAEAGKDLAALRAELERAKRDGAVTPGKERAIYEKAAERRAEGKGYDKERWDIDDILADLDRAEGGSVTKVDEDGAVSVEVPKKEPREPDPVLPYSVVHIPPNQALFMNYETNDEFPNDEHIAELERLVGLTEMVFGGVESVEGHASRAGSEKHNLELGDNRAYRLFSIFEEMAEYYGAHMNMMPDDVFSTGETNPFRERFRHIPKIADAPHRGHRNDPIEKGVLLTYRPTPDAEHVEPKSVWIGGILFQFIGRALVVGDNLFAFRIDGGVTHVDRSTQTVINQTIINNTTIQVDDRRDQSQTINIDFGGDTMTITTGDQTTVVQIKDGRPVPPPDGGGGGGGRPSTARHTDWKLFFHTLQFEDETSLKDILERVARFIADLRETPYEVERGSAFDQFLDGVLGMTSPDAIVEKLIEYVVGELGGGVSDVALELFGSVRFATITFEGVISAKDDPSGSVEGTFVGPGVVFGTRSPTSSSAFLNGADYKTAVPMTPEEWKTAGAMAKFGYLNNGMAGHAAALPDLLQTMADNLPVDFALPEVVSAITDAMRTAISAAEQLGGQSGLQFRAFEGDTEIDVDPDDVSFVGFDFHIMAVRRGRLAFR